MQVHNLEVGKGLHDYAEIWQLQREIHAEVRAGTRPDTVLLVEHHNVYTAGRRTRQAERPFDVPVIDVDRGGKITWHGPGQLVVYPIIRLPEPIDVVAYVRTLEAAVIALCADFGVTAGRVDGRSGVWLPATQSRRTAKIAAIGCRVAGGVTMHGAAINANPDMAAFDAIVPCGITDADVTSLTQITGASIMPTELVAPAITHLRAFLPTTQAASVN